MNMPIKNPEELKVEFRMVNTDYNNALAFISEAKEHERSGKEEQAIDSYFHAALWARGTNNAWEVLSSFGLRDADNLDDLLSHVPSLSDIEGLWPQIFSGLNGRMKDLYEGPEREEWQKRRDQEIKERSERENYLLKTGLDEQQTVQALDVLRGIDGLKLSYEKVLYLRPDQKHDIEELIANQRTYMERQITEVISRSLELPQGTLVSHDIHLNLELYDNPTMYLMSRHSSIDIQEKEGVRVGMNFDGKTGLEIVQIGFRRMRGDDPDVADKSLVYVVNSEDRHTRPQSPELADTYHLQVRNPESFKLPSQVALNKAVERAKYITNLLTAVK